MTRALLQHVVQDEDGDIQADVSVSVLRADNTTPVAGSMYDAPTGGSVLSQPLVTNSKGLVQAWIDEDNAVAIRLSLTGATPNPYSLFYHDPSIVVRLTATQTLTNKTLTSPTLTTPTLTGTSTVTGDLDVSATGSLFAKLGVGESAAPTQTTFLAVNNSQDAHGVMADFSGSAVANGIDVGTGRFVMSQMTSNTGNLIRALELDTLVDSSAVGLVGSWIVEANLSRETASTSPLDGCGFRINSGNFSPTITGAVRQGAALAVVGSGAGWSDALYYLDTDDATVLARITQTGQFTGGHIVARTNDTFDLGTTSSRWAHVYATLVLPENGTVSAPSHSFRQDAASGVYLSTTSVVGVAAAGAEKLRVDAAGVAFAAGYRVQENTVATITPATITSNQDNYNPTGLATASRLRLGSDASRNITGIVAQTAGTVLHLQNLGGQNIVLKHEVTSTAANRIQLPSATDVTIPSLGAYSLIYDGGLSRWIQYVG